jgi:hypothetical protein
VAVLTIRLSVLYSFARREDQPEPAPDRRLSVLASSFQSVVSESYDTRVLRTTYKCKFRSGSDTNFPSLDPSGQYHGGENLYPSTSAIISL